MSRWPNLSELIVGKEKSAPVGLVGVPLAAGSVTPGNCDLAPPLLRQTLRRIGCYDVETKRELRTHVTDRGRPPEEFVAVGCCRRMRNERELWER